MSRRIGVLLVAVLVAATVLSTGQARAYSADDEWNTCYDNGWGYVVCADDEVANAIWSAAADYGVDGDLLMRVAACENDFLWWPVGPYGELGIFQFLPDTFYGITGGAGDPQNVWDAAYAAAWAFANGDAGWWTCYWIVG